MSAMDRIEPEQWKGLTSGWQCIEEAGKPPRPSRLVEIIADIPGEEFKKELIATTFYNGDAKRQGAIVQMILDAPALAAGKARAAFLEERVKVLEKAIRDVLAYSSEKSAFALYLVNREAFEALCALMYEEPELQGSEAAL
jgi:hypothetical protein